jgi:hypothetical protein
MAIIKIIALIGIWRTTQENSYYRHNLAGPERWAAKQDGLKR